MLHLRSSKLWQLVLVEFEVWSVVADAVFFLILCTAEVLSKRETAKKRVDAVSVQQLVNAAARREAANPQVAGADCTISVGHGCAALGTRVMTKLRRGHPSSMALFL